ncbi:hypothetical protein DINM_002086 [Dirofilaria immitis]|nr:hypothetical protein [Dirofilaria immitis]
MSLVEQLISSSDRWIAVQFAFYNVLLLTLTGLCLAGLYAVYKMMYMFLTPLLWAILIGTILFPFKKRFNNAINGWLSRVDNEGKPFVVAVIFIPYDAFINATDLFLIHLARREGILVLGAYLILKVLNHITFIALLHLLGDLYRNTDYIILSCTKTWVSILMILYFAAFVGWFYVQDHSSMNKKLARLISALYASGILIRGEVKADDSKNRWFVLFFHIALVSIENKEKTFDQELTGDFYLQAIIGLSALEFAVQHNFVSVCALFLAIFTVMRRIDKELITESSGRFFNCFSYVTADFWVSFITVIVAFQVHGEVAHLTRLGANLLSQQPDWMLDYARNYTGNQLEKRDIDNYIEQGYLKGREWLAANVRSFVGTQDPVKGNYLERTKVMKMIFYAKMFLIGVFEKDSETNALISMGIIIYWHDCNLILGQLLDKLYEMWEDHNETNISSSSSATKDWTTQLEAFTSISTLREEVVELVKANVDTIISVTQSIWSFIIANISTLGTILFTILAIVINFGLEILNFFIEITVFLTALYYLLASSQDIWLPIKWLRDALPPPHNTDSGPPYIIPAIEKAISGVFVLSTKMSLFYVLAAVFASVPVVAPCIVCIFGFLELYFAEHETAAAILFVLISLAPKAFAETAFIMK